MRSRTILLGLGLVATTIWLNSFARRPAIGGSLQTQNKSVSAVALSKRRAPAGMNVAAVAPQTLDRLPSQIREAVVEVERIHRCYESECDYPRSYPRDYDYAIGRDLKEILFVLQDLVEQKGFTDPEIARLARENLANEDGHVKEAALHLLATQPVSSENLQSILNDVISENDPELIAHAMLELKRYTNPSDLKSIHEALATAMLTGTPFVSEAVSKSVVRFIDSESFGYFSEIATRVSPGSRVKANLQFSLAEYRRRASGA